MAKQATLVNKAGNRVAVDTGSQSAQGYFNQGYTLETKAPSVATQPNPTVGTPAVTTTQVTPATPAPVTTTIPATNPVIGTPKTTTLQVNKNLLDKPVPSSALSPSAPKMADLPKVYRIGGDIYDANSNQKLGLTDFTNNYKKAIEVAAPKQTPEQAQASQAAVEAAKPQTAAERIASFYDTYTNGATAAKEQAIADTGLNDKSQAVTDSQLVLNDARTALQNENILDQKELLALQGQGRGLTTGLIQGRAAQLNQQQKLDFALLQNNYNNALVASQIASGAYDRAHETVRETADDFYKNSTMQLNILQQQNQIDEQTKNRLDKELQAERELALNGYVYVKDPAALKGKTEQDIYRDPITGKVYLKPPKQIKQVIEANGQLLGIDEQGNTLKVFGSTATPVKTGEHYDAQGNLVADYSVWNPNTRTMEPVSGGSSTFTGTADAQSIANAIKKVESGGNYDAKGGSGENGAYQFMPATWAGYSREYADQVLNKSVASLPMTKENQDAVVQFKIQQWLDQGLTPQQIAAKWNSGSEVGWENKVGTNSKGQKYDVPAYVNKVMGALGSGQPVNTANKTPEGYDISKFTQNFYNTPNGQKALNNEQQYRSNFLAQQSIKDFQVVQNKAAAIEKVLESGVGGPGDLAAVFDFMKALDPNSVVRESEYDKAAGSGNIFAGVFARFNGYLKEEGGFLPENVKKDFISIMKTKYNVSKQSYDQLRNQYRKDAYEQGLNPDHVAPSLIVDSTSNEAIDFTQFYK